MTDKEEKAVERCNQLIKVEHANWIGISNQVAIETLLKLTQTQQEEIEKKDKIINNSINEIEKIRQYFSEDLQVEFIRILEILKDKKVMDW